MEGTSSLGQNPAYDGRFFTKIPRRGLKTETSRILSVNYAKGYVKIGKRDS